MSACLTHRSPTGPPTPDIRLFKRVFVICRALSPIDAALYSGALSLPDTFDRSNNSDGWIAEHLHVRWRHTWTSTSILFTSSRLTSLAVTIHDAGTCIQHVHSLSPFAIAGRTGPLPQAVSENLHACFDCAIYRLMWQFRGWWSVLCFAASRVMNLPALNGSSLGCCVSLSTHCSLYV